MCFGAKQRQTQQLQQQGGEGPRGAPLRRLRPRAPYRPAGAGRAMLRPEPSPEGAGWKDNARHRIGRSRSRPLGGRSCDYTSWQPSPPCQVHRVTFSFGTLPQPAAKARQRFPSRRPHERMFTSRHSHCLAPPGSRCPQTQPRSPEASPPQITPLRGYSSSPVLSRSSGARIRAIIPHPPGPFATFSGVRGSGQGSLLSGIGVCTVPPGRVQAVTMDRLAVFS